MAPNTLANCTKCKVLVEITKKHNPETVRCIECADKDARCCRCSKKAVHIRVPTDGRSYCNQCVPPQPAAPTVVSQAPERETVRTPKRAASRTARRKTRSCDRCEERLEKYPDGTLYCPECLLCQQGCGKRAKQRTADDGKHYCKACFQAWSQAAAVDGKATEVTTATSLKKEKPAPAAPVTAAPDAKQKSKPKSATVMVAAPQPKAAPQVLVKSSEPKPKTVAVKQAAVAVPAAAVASELPQCVVCNKAARSIPDPATGLHYCRKCFAAKTSTASVAVSDETSALEPVSKKLKPKDIKRCIAILQKMLDEQSIQ